MNLQELIKKIIPFYNNYKKNQQNLTGVQAMEIIWEVGDLLKKYLDGEDIAPRTLYYQIYGKSEGDLNISQRSYITRDFLDRAYRVRRIFKDKKEINKIFPKLRRYRLFYKSMPFFDEGRYKMDKIETEKLVILLNSNKTYKEIIGEVAKLKKERIGLNIPRDSKLKELDNEKKIFIDFYNFIYKQIKNRDYKKAVKNIGECGGECIVLLSRNTGALASDSLQLSEFEISSGLSKEWKDFAEIIKKLISRKDASERRRFRRLIPPEKMMRLSEMIYAMKSEEYFNRFRL